MEFGILSLFLLNVLAEFAIVLLLSRRVHQL